MEQERVAQYINQKRLFMPTDKVIIALSGGADSVALLCLLQTLGYNCEAAHCNFHLRGKESDRDEAFVCQLCAKRQVPLHIVHFNTVRTAEERHISIEMAARELRYEWFEEIRRKSGANVIAVAHHRDDSVEMGFVKGKTVEVLLNAPLKDPVKYKVMGYEISLRHQEAEMIEIVGEQEMLRDAVHLDYHEGMSEDMRLSEEELKRIALGKRRTINVALVGNPNCGKTSLFNIASGSHEHVGNYSGVTVDAKEGYFDFQGYHFRIVDLPGTYSLSAYSPEEIYVRHHIINETPDIIINVVDSSNLERNLYLTTQLIDMNVRMVIALNMYDELEASGNTLDYVKLGQLFGVPMLPTISRTGKGIEQLFHVIIGIYEGGDFLDKKGKVRAEILNDLRNWHKEYVPDHDFGTHKEEKEHPVGFYRHIHINHGPELERSIEEVKRVISVNENIRYKYSTRFLAIKLLENDGDLEKIVQEFPNGKDIIEVRNREEQRLRNAINEDSEQAITDAKYGFISGALRETYVDNHEDTARTTRVIDSIVTHRVWGYPIFFLFLYLMFEGTFILGDYPMQGIEWLVGVLGDWVRNNMSEGPLKDLLVDGIIGGVGGVIVFLPNILILYFFISLMEDSGYMARAAFIMDKIMHKMGLHGKSFIPLIMGFGCNVPAIMASRTIENRKSRLVTMLINPLMSCSARLPIYLLLVGAFFPNNASLVLLVIYAIGILLAVVMARLFCRFLVKGDDTPFVMELPPYRIPTSKSIFHQRSNRDTFTQTHRISFGVICIQYAKCTYHQFLSSYTRKNTNTQLPIEAQRFYHRLHGLTYPTDIRIFLLFGHICICVMVRIIS
jgi:ferrous iron transport protein B